MGWQDAPEVEAAPAWASAPEVGAAKAKPSLAERVLRGVGTVGSAASAGAASLGEILDPVVAAAGTAGSYIVPQTAGHFFDSSGRDLGPESTVGERWKAEMEGLRRTRGERSAASPNAFGAGAILEGGAVGPALAKLAPFSRMAPGGSGAGPLLARMTAGAADAATVNAASAAASNLDRDPLRAASEAASSPMNLIGAVPAVTGPLREVGQAAGRAGPKLLSKLAPKVQPTEAAKLLRREGVPLTLGQMNPDSGYAALEQASADNPLGMHLERAQAADAWRNVVMNKAAAPGADLPTSGGPQERMRALYEGFDPAYSAVKEAPVPGEALRKLHSAADALPQGIDQRTRQAVANEVENALTVLPPDVVAGGRAVIPPGADPFHVPSRTQRIDMPEGSDFAKATIPSWLHPDDFHGNRAAWDWTWQATGGPTAPEQLQKLVYPYMRDAVTMPETDFPFGANPAQAHPGDFGMRQGWTAARVAKGGGGARWSKLRDALHDWALAPEHVRGEDPISKTYPGRDPWGALMDTAKKDINWGHGNAYGGVEKMDAMAKWLNEAKANLSPERINYKSTPPEWYREGYAGSPGAAADAMAPQAEPLPPVKAGDLMKVRSNIREQTQTARRAQDWDRLRLLGHAEDVITGALEESLPPEQAARLKDIDRQYAKLMTVEHAAPAGKDAFTPGQLARSVEQSAGRRAFKQGRAGDLQDLAEAGAQTLDTRVKPTGMREVVLAGMPKLVAGPAARLLNQPSVKAALLGETLTAPPMPQGLTAPTTEAQARALAMAEAMRRYGPTLQLGAPVQFGGPLPAAADGERQ